jgi:hypothetical protein
MTSRERLPQLVGDVEVVVGHVVALVVTGQALETEVRRRVRQVRRDDVPTDPAVRQVVEGGDLTSERERMGLQDRAGEREPEVLGNSGHRGDEQHRIVDRDLHALSYGDLRATPVGVVDAEHVGQEQRVEATGLEDLRQFEPRVELRVLALAGVVTRPQALLDVRHAVHREGVE